MAATPLWQLEQVPGKTDVGVVVRRQAVQFLADGVDEVRGVVIVEGGVAVGTPLAHAGLVHGVGRIGLGLGPGSGRGSAVADGQGGRLAEVEAAAVVVRTGGVGGARSCDNGLAVQQAEVGVAMRIMAGGASQVGGLEAGRPAAGSAGQGGFGIQAVPRADHVVTMAVAGTGLQAVGIPGPGLGDPVEVPAGAPAGTVGELTVIGVATQAGGGGIVGPQQVGIGHQTGDGLPVFAVVHGVAAGAIGNAAVMEGQRGTAAQSGRRHQRENE